MSSILTKLKMKLKKCLHLIIIILVMFILSNIWISFEMDNYLKRLNIFKRVSIDDETDLIKDVNEAKNYVDLVFKSIVSQHLEYCPEIPHNLVGKIKIKSPPQNFDAFSNNLFFTPVNYTQTNSRWSPTNCKPRHRVAIIIPYKDRLSNLNYFLINMHPFLQKQLLEYQIFVVEQSNDQMFNKGVLMNSGFIEIMSLKSYRNLMDNIEFKSAAFPFDCVIFHDVDLLPEDDRIMYSCPKRPRHLSVAINKFKYKAFYAKLIGGVLNFKTKHYIKANGYSNEYWGWGGEDDDMEVRLSNSKLLYERPTIDIAHYSMIKHPSRFKNPRRGLLLKQAKKRYQNDGISNVNYTITRLIDRVLFTHYYIDVGDPPKYIMDLLNPPVPKTTSMWPLVNIDKDEKKINNSLNGDMKNLNKENEIKYEFIHLN